MAIVRIYALVALVLIATAPILTAPSGAISQGVASREGLTYSVKEEDGWKVISTDVITVKFPTRGRHPIFIWWYTQDNRTAYVVHYSGLVEFFSPALELRYKGRSWFNKKLIEGIVGEEGKKLDEMRAQTRENLERVQKMNELAEEMITLIIRMLVRINLGTTLKEEAGDLKELALRLKKIAAELFDARISEKVERSLTLIEKILSEKLTRGEVVRTLRDLANILERLMRETYRMIREHESALHRIQRRIEKFQRFVFKEIMRHVEKMHTGFLPFAAARWELSDIEPIRDEEGREIGLKFTYTLVESRIPHFKFAEGNILMTNKFYYVTVNETVGDLTYTVTRAELKTDVILKKWMWNSDIFRRVVAEANRAYNLSIPLPPPERSGLALRVSLASFNTTKLKLPLEEVAEKLDEIRAFLHPLPGMLVVGEGIRRHVSVERATLEGEEENIEPRVKRGHLTFKFTTENVTLGGYFKFVNSATLFFPNATEKTVLVRAAYREVGSHLKLFMIYPYFGDATLIHDPSIGLEIREVIEALYVVTVNIVPEGTQIAEVRRIVEPPVTPVAYLPIPVLIVGWIVLTVAVLVTALLVERKKISTVEVLDTK